MDNIIVLIAIGFLVGTLGTLIGAGGGFILVPFMLLAFPTFSPDVVTAISIAVVAANATSGSTAYMRAKRVDYKAGIIFAICTIPGSILGVITTKYIPRGAFDLLFGVILIVLAVFLFFRGKKKAVTKETVAHPSRTHQRLVDKWGEEYDYSYNLKLGMFISVLVGYFSPLLGIGGGIIHVPAMIEWLNFPVHLATATSHFILAIMATVSVIVHTVSGTYNDPLVLKMTLSLIVGVIGGAQLGAFLSRRIQGKFIVKALAISLAIVGIRILTMGMSG
ncbi:MAG: sulfite exporter TauE/SafE family protein [Chitinophagaceae bacterium]|nr:sulfite exporter TauE/SafE family protein [Chitinophagaceae bacterium]MCW5914761.1 sulfite exporter TauE/SafE family protein [Chitinophagaceae bacterium]MCZ2396306.1 sulfite exporter TauE/SafE family protein [Chitinophagales bacterium]